MITELAKLHIFKAEDLLTLKHEGLRVKAQALGISANTYFNRLLSISKDLNPILPVNDAQVLSLV